MYIKSTAALIRFSTPTKGLIYMLLLASITSWWHRFKWNVHHHYRYNFKIKICSLILLSLMLTHVVEMTKLERLYKSKGKT